MELISPKTACQRLGVCKSTLWRMQRSGNFPRSITLSTGRKGCVGRIGFVADEVEAWIAAKMADRDGAK